MGLQHPRRRSVRFRHKRSTRPVGGTSGAHRIDGSHLVEQAIIVVAQLSIP
jgi:hypothetical protein